MFFIIFISITILEVNHSPITALEASEITPFRSREKRVGGGRKTLITQFPYLVGLEFSLASQCGGSILTSNVIVTAAHCVEGKNPSQMQVRAGSSIKGIQGSVHYVRKFVNHPRYRTIKNNKGSHSENDLALMWLENPIEVDNKSKKAIELFGPNETSPDGAKAMTAGWGRLGLKGPNSNQLQSLEMKIVDQKKCSEIWNEFYEVFFEEIYEFYEGQICAESANNERTESVCKGDSGGPLVIDGRLAGVVSGTARCTSIPYPNLFTEISHFRKWIDEVLVEFGKEKISTTLYNGLINKMDGIRKSIKDVIDLEGFLYHLPYQPNSSVREKAEYDLFDKPFVSQVDAVIESLKLIFGKDLKENCWEVVKNQNNTLRKQIYSYIWKKVQIQVEDDYLRILNPAVQEFDKIEASIRQCLQVKEPNNGLCDLNKIDAQVDSINDKLNIKYLKDITENIGKFIFSKNKKYIYSLIYENIYSSVKECMGMVNNALRN